MTNTHIDVNAAISVMVALAGVARVVVLESEAISAGSMSVKSCGQMATDSGPRRSERVTQQPARLLDALEVYVAQPHPSGMWRANAKQ